MNFLIIAYEFPPISSPQSLRWMYLTRELAVLGHEVHVLSVDVMDSRPLLAVPGGVSVHRTSAGPVRGTLDYLARRNLQKNIRLSSVAIQEVAAYPGTLPGSLNWKGRLVARIHEYVQHFVFPDLRGEWRWSARHRLRSLLKSLKPDVVVSSHEPASTLELGSMASRLGHRWVADLGDPVLASYTPERWRKRAFKVEARTCDEAAAITVTTSRMQALLVERHGTPPEKIHLVTQGFDPGPVRPIVASECKDANQKGQVDILYTGSFYEFRGIDALLNALEGCKHVRLRVVTAQAPRALSDYAVRHPGQVQISGFQPHEEVLRMQRGADILLNLGNADPVQIPGKFFEYLGAGKPILHISQCIKTDDTAALLRQFNRGWVVESDPTSIAIALSVFEHPGWEESLDLRPARVAEYSWNALAAKMVQVAMQGPEA